KAPVESITHGYAARELRRRRTQSATTPASRSAPTGRSAPRDALQHPPLLVPPTGSQVPGSLAFGEIVQIAWVSSSASVDFGVSPQVCVGYIVASVIFVSPAGTAAHNGTGLPWSSIHCGSVTLNRQVCSSPCR